MSAGFDFDYKKLHLRFPVRNTINTGFCEWSYNVS